MQKSLKPIEAVQV